MTCNSYAEKYTLVGQADQAASRAPKPQGASEQRAVHSGKLDDRILGCGSLDSSVNSTTVGFFGTVDKIRGKYSNMIDLISLQTRFRF